MKALNKKIKELIENISDLTFEYKEKGSPNYVLFRYSLVEFFKLENNDMNVRATMVNSDYDTYQLLLQFKENFTKVFYRFEYYLPEYQKDYELEVIYNITKNELLLVIDDTLEHSEIRIS